MTSSQKPSLWRVLSDACRIISSNPLHFLALSSLFIFPTSLFKIINTQPTPFQSHFSRLLLTGTVSTQRQKYSETHPTDKYQYLFVLLFHLCSVASITHSIFNGIHNKQPLKLSSSLKSILSSFFPLFATKMAFVVIEGAILIGFGLFMWYVMFGIAMMGFEIDGPIGKYFAIVVSVMTKVISVYFGVKWIFMDAIVVVESMHKDFSVPLERSSRLVKGKRVVALALLMMFLFWALNVILSAGCSTLAAKAAGSRGWLALHVVVYGGVSTILTLFDLAANMVFFVHCKAFHGESAAAIPSYDKLGEVYQFIMCLLMPRARRPGVI